MAEISIDNGLSWHDNCNDFDDSIIEQIYDTIVSHMGDEDRETVHTMVAPCTKREFLDAYMLITGKNLIYG